MQKGIFIMDVTQVNVTADFSLYCNNVFVSKNGFVKNQNATRSFINI